MKMKKILMLMTLVILFIAMNNISSANSAITADFNGNRTITVMSRNLYLGTDLGPVINAKNQTELSEAIMRSYSEIQATDYSTRAQALAIEIADKKPDLIGLQEVVLIRGQALKNPAATIEFDYLKILLNELAKLGQNYDTVAVSNGFNMEIPCILPEGSSCRDLRLTDREVILARNDPETSDLKLSNVQERNFTHNLIIPILDNQFTVSYGWASVDVEIQGNSFRFISTHLEPTSSVVQLAQSNELLQDPANTTLPVVLVCDCNSDASGNGTDTYENLIAAGFIDAWSQTHHVNPGFTCCQDSNLLNNNSNLSERIDLVLFRGSFNATKSDIVGDNSSDRILSPSGLLLWPSDHAGIVAKLSFSLEKPVGGAISGMKFHDSNNNGTKDQRESGLSNWTIVLKNSSGSIATMKTDSNGNYSFVGLPAGNYTVEEVLQADWMQTFPKVPGTYNVTLKEGEIITGIDFGNNLKTPMPSGVKATREIEKGSIRLGESISITVRISSNVIQALVLQEFIPTGWNLTRISDDADGFKKNSKEWAWSNSTPGAIKTVNYVITPPTGADIGTYYINGTIINPGGIITIVRGNNMITLDIIAYYIRLGSDPHRIETADLLKAMDDWRNGIKPSGFARPITSQELSTLINEWAMA